MTKLLHNIQKNIKMFIQRKLVTVELLWTFFSRSHNISFHKFGSLPQRSADVRISVNVTDDKRWKSAFNSCNRRSRRPLYVSCRRSDDTNLHNSSQTIFQLDNFISQVWSKNFQLWNPLRMCAMPEGLRGLFTMRSYTNPRYLTNSCTCYSKILTNSSSSVFNQSFREV